MQAACTMLTSDHHMHLAGDLWLVVAKPETTEGIATGTFEALRMNEAAISNYASAERKLVVAL